MWFLWVLSEGSLSGVRDHGAFSIDMIGIEITLAL